MTLTREVLLDLVVLLDLPRPHDATLRRAGGSQAWLAQDYSVLLAGWMGNWPTLCIAEQIGRSRGSIWAKTRRMGLPRRERRSLVWPILIPAMAQDWPIEPVVPERLPDEWMTRGTQTPIRMQSKRGGSEVDWAGSSGALIDIGMRCWSGQRPRKIAEDYGVSYRTITSQLHWLQIPTMPRTQQVDHFDPDIGNARMTEAKYKMMTCVSDERFPYWTHRMRREKSRRDVKAKLYDAAFI
ncbi:hypothetical protein HN018_23320 (plasmid) [Lichenicola cladoniae]|uniref:Uncharacterized protein n=1 Tax=Lichenicola cladoniae TaxID=1484109 RepID=A0A6M8HY55_9PROT|nr:hypothetical protein [Lichenicola cladoniae]NPD66350.1 hypothetical protein [Acetobacteraceae bacterium]QKE93117.1 hypothetical protein HN018_23320 [Lichenicola cladoniae]